MAPTCSTGSSSSAFADRRLGTLSGGERQRLVIARALAQEAPILLLDEPTSALDIGHQQQALELVARLRREHGLTVVSAMHDLTLAGLYSDRLALLHEGQCVAARPGGRRAAGRDAGRVLRRAGHRPPRARRHRGGDPRRIPLGSAQQLLDAPPGRAHGLPGRRRAVPSPARVIPGRLDPRRAPPRPVRRPPASLGTARGGVVTARLAIRRCPCSSSWRPPFPLRWAT